MECPVWMCGGEKRERGYIDSNQFVFPLRRGRGGLGSTAPAAVVEAGQAALAGLPEAAVEAEAGLLHGLTDHIVADVPGARKPARRW